MWGEGRGEGPERAAWPPHPNPLPRNTHCPKATSIAGERGQELTSADSSDAHTSRGVPC